VQKQKPGEEKHIRQNLAAGATDGFIRPRTKPQARFIKDIQLEHL